MQVHYGVIADKLRNDSVLTTQFEQEGYLAYIVVGRMLTDKLLP